MPKITERIKQVYDERALYYDRQIAAVLTKEKQTLGGMSKNPQGAAFKRIALSDEMLNLVSLYLAKNSLSVAILNSKNEDALNDARKTIYRVLIYLEDTVSNYIDAPYSDYADKVDEIAEFPETQRYYLVRKFGLAIRMLEDAYGDNTKWRWTFVEIEARFATIAKNIMDLKKATKEGLDPYSPDYDVTVYHLRLVKKLLSQAANRYREKYELSTGRIDDIRLGINYLLALRRIHLILNERNDAEEAKRKADIWQQKMDKDQKKSQKESQKR